MLAIGLISLFVVCVAFSCFVKCINKETSKYRLVSWALLSAYLLLTFYSTVCNRVVSEDYNYHLVPLWSYFSIRDNASLVGQIILNILLFVPIGTLANVVGFTIKRTVLYSAVFSLTIEIFQLIFRTGMFEFDDIFHNVIGGLIGYEILYILDKTLNRRKV